MNRFVAQWPVALGGLLYIAQSAKQGFAGNWPMCGMWAAYALANVALIFAQS